MRRRGTQHRTDGDGVSDGTQAAARVADPETERTGRRRDGRASGDVAGRFTPVRTHPLTHTRVFYMFLKRRTDVQFYSQ